jgi:hypothetical protein
MKSEEKELDEAQNDQDETGEAGSDPETSGPAENLRERTRVKIQKNPPESIGIPFNDPFFLRLLDVCMVVSSWNSLTITSVIITIACIYFVSQPLVYTIKNNRIF